jgi:hypothetical protein
MGPREAQLREMREARVEANLKKIDRTTKRVSKVAKPKRSGRGR